MGDVENRPGMNGVLEAAIYVDDLAAAENFYGEVLGLPVILRREGAHVFFRCGSTVVLVFKPEITRAQKVSGDSKVPPHGAEGAGHLCFSVSSAQIADWAQHLAASDIEVESDFQWPNGARSIYVRDPAGNSIEFAESWLWEAGR